MNVTLEKVMAQATGSAVFSWTELDTMFFALAIGMSGDPADEQELDYTYERRGTLKALPAQAFTLASHKLLDNIGMDQEKFMHAEQLLTLHGPLPVSGTILADHRVTNVWDKGAAKGVMVETESRMRLVDGTPLFDVCNLYYCRGDGGIGSSGSGPRPAHRMPDRAPDMVRSTVTEPRQALLYRLIGDRNAIHGDPKIAGELGFDGPILHGSCTLAIACREVLAGVCGYDDALIKSFGARYTAVAYPGDRIETDIWIDGVTVSFRCRVPERNAVILDLGQCRIG